MGSRRSSDSLDQPHPRPVAPADEPDPCLLQRPPKGRQDGAPGLRDASLKLAQRDHPNLSRTREVILGPIEKRAGGAALGWRHVVILIEHRF
jgi:hypothetical protein